MVKAFLKGADGSLFPLLHKVTTVGRENCDLTIQLPGVDYQHCVLEYNELDDCFIIQDLNTAQGTYVNDVRIQNAAVRLAPGDHVRFSYNGQPFELQLDSQPQLNIPPVSQRPPSWNPPLTMINSDDVYNVHTSQYSSLQTFPQISYANTPPQPTSTWAHPSMYQPPPPMPRPPLRSRPLSAGAARRNLQNVPAVGPTVGPSVPRTSTTGGWVTQPITRAGSTPDLQEKDQRILQLSDEISRLKTFEFDSFRKDTLLQQYQQQIAELQNKLRQEPSIIMGGDSDLSSKLLHLETEVSAKKGEISALREQLSKLQDDRSNSPQLLRQELGERIKEISSLRGELERVKKDKNITSGLVTQMQRDMSNKDASISRMAREIEVLKKDIRERESRESQTVVKEVREVPPYLKLNVVKEKDQESSKAVEEHSARERELISLRQKFKATESKIQEQADLITGLREELEKTKAQVLQEKENHKKILTDLETSRTQIIDVQRTERVVRVDLEQAQKRFERFRSKVFQVTFSTPGVQAPETEITDDELIEALKKFVGEQNTLHSQIKELEASVASANSGKEELLNQAEKLKEVLMESSKRLTGNGRLVSSLKQEMSIIQSVSTEQNLTWIRDLLHEMISSELDWETRIEQALEHCGVNVKISNEEPGKHIESLMAKWESSLKESDSLKAQISAHQESHKAELELRLSALTSDMEARLQDAVEKTRLEGETKLNLAIDEIRAVETAKRESSVEAERRKIDELQEALEQLRAALAERQSEDQAKLTEACVALQELEFLRNSEQSLKEEITKLEKLRVEESEKFNTEKAGLEAKFETDLSSYREQIKQHSVTIVTMEERLEKMMKKNKDYVDEISKLKSEKSSKPTLLPKPKVIIQRPVEELAALELVINALRQENTVLKKEIKDSQDCIKGLRKDLSGASARLSDISGEMSESQKQEMERNRELLKQKSNELTELRQQMVKLTQIIDTQKEEVKKLQAELKKEQSLCHKYKVSIEEHSVRSKSLEEELRREKEEQKKQLDLIDQEGRITTELTSLGAQCRGERHEQIINRQRDALAELRSKVKLLEQSKPTLPTQDQALHQVLMLKKELAEMRVNQAYAEDKIIQSSTSLDREIGKARGMIGPGNFEAEMEKSAHKETLDALDCSEATFMTLLRSMASSLDVDELEGMRPMAHAPRDEREFLMAARERTAQLLANRILMLKERIARKDELLKGYELDLAKLRQSQELTERQSKQVESLANDIRSRSEESEYLRESLSRTRDRLNQEKRLNSAIKQRKTFHLENERAHLQNHTRGHHCPIQDPKSVVKARQQKDLMKRKNYEIRVLKENLCETEKELFEREKKILSMAVE
ncbi:forkhead-associated domain-containing protein 1-like isoform X1 [Biomphalaria glabrata]|uniref:Forkhead-associated domain-containing protein 1-like isoform X1 n=2 Tax=Biomphalaria glabrata TaxID=6526 RepID=A0A9W2YKV9_BIOGL|nr:forkhead-associated domain-containing protein 1-like isoform X1 [Biomphalaria glabrata]